MTAIATLGDVRPGDLYFAGMSGAPAKALVYAGQLALGEFVAVGRFVVGHVGIVVEASRTLPPGTVRFRRSGRYYTPEDQREGPSAEDRRDGDYDTYETGVITAPQLVEAMPSGARRRELRASDWSAKTAFVRLPETYDGQHLDAAAIAELMIGTPYSFGSYAQLAAWRFGWKTWRLEERINRRREPIAPQWPGSALDGKFLALPTEAICSVLADQAWSLAGARVMVGVKPQIVTPGALALQLLRRPGVEWGGLGILG